MPPLYIVHRSLLLLARLVAASVLRLSGPLPQQGCGDVNHSHPPGLQGHAFTQQKVEAIEMPPVAG